MRTLCALVLAFVSSGVIHAVDLQDPNFTHTDFITTGLSSVTGMAWATDGSNRLFVAQKGGQIRLIKDGTLLTTPFATLTPVFTDSECGLIGICVDPNYATTKHIYVFVTRSNTEQQIVRFTDTNDVGTAETLIKGGLPTTGNNHDGGGVGIGADGKLYFAVGDQGNRTGVDDDLTTLAAKVGRCNLDGSAPNDNPFFDGSGNPRDFIFARGLRNPFTLTFQPATNKLWVNVVGDSYEQIFLVESGNHIGYDNFENNQPDGFITPRIKYRTNGSDERTITAGGAVRANNVITVTTSSTHGFRKGERITLAGISPASLNGSVFVASTPTATTFTATQNGADATGGGGTAETATIGGSLTGGCFYNGTTFPSAYAGNFFFGDFNTGRIMRATLDSADNSVTSVQEFVTGASQAIDLAVGPDGALYYCRFGGAIGRIAANNSSPGNGLDTDSDGVTDVNEIADGTNPLDATSFNTTAFTIAKLTGTVKFGLTAKDKISVSGIIPALPAGFVPDDQNVLVDIAGATSTFVLTDKAAQKKDDKSTIAIKLKPSQRNKMTKKNEFLGGDVSFKTTLNGTFTANFSDEGVVANVKDKIALSFRVDLSINGRRYRATVPVEFKSSDKSGSIKRAKE